MPGKKGKPAGSLKTGEPAFLAVGKIRRPHGLNGDVLVALYTDFPERLVPGKALYWGDKHREITINSQRAHKDGMLIGFVGIHTPEEAGQLRNQILYVPASDVPELKEDEYYFHQLVDLAVVDDSGEQLGILTEVIETGANDVYVVTSPLGKEILLPAIKDVVINIDINKGRMVVHLLPGLLDVSAKDGRE